MTEPQPSPVVRHLRALDFPCPKCKAEKGEPCTNVRRTRHAPKGAQRSTPHGERAAQVPRRAETHGTYSGLQRHTRRGEVPCEPCRLAGNAYMRRYRSEHPADYAAEKTRNAARARALVKLSHQYPDEFARLYAEEQSA